LEESPSISKRIGPAKTVCITGKRVCETSQVGQGQVNRQAGNAAKHEAGTMHIAMFPDEFDF